MATKTTKTEKKTEEETGTCPVTKTMTPEEVMLCEYIPVECRRLVFEDSFRQHLTSFSIEREPGRRATLLSRTRKDEMGTREYVVTRVPAAAVRSAWEFYSKYCPDGPDPREFISRIISVSEHGSVFEADIINLD